MVAAVCRKMAPAANANRPHRVTYRAPPITARSTLGCDSVALSCVLVRIAWPRKNATKAVTIVITRATRAKTIALAANKVTRRGIAVSDVLIIPVEYSAVSTSAPNTTMTSCPRKNNPATLIWVASKVARSEAEVCDQLADTPAEMAAPIPMLITTSTSSVHQVERTERILVNSERSVPPSPARPDGGGSTGAPGACLVIAAMSGPPFATELLVRGQLLLSRPGPLQALDLLRSLTFAAPVFHAVRGQLHEGRLERGPDHGQLVQPHAVLEREVADLGGDQAGDDQRAAGAGDRAAARLGDRPGQLVRLGGGDPDGLARAAGDELVHGAVGEQLAAPDHDQVVGGVLHLRHQVAGHEHRAALGGERLHQVADPQNSFWVQPVDRLVEHQDPGVPEQRPGDAEPLAHAEREP